MHRSIRKLRRRLSRLHHPGGGYAAAFACATLAVAGIVLLQTPKTRAAPEPQVVVPPDSNLRSTHTEVQLGAVHAVASLARGAVLAHGERPLLLEVSLSADDDARHPRPPIAMSIVLDTSGSMTGEKISQARRAVAQTIERMQDGDQVALIAYSSSARVVLTPSSSPLNRRRSISRRSSGR